MQRLARCQISSLSFVLRTWPISFTDSPVHFVFFPLVYFRAFTGHRPEKEWEFSFRISFSIKILCLPGGKAVQLLCNPPPNTEAKWQGKERVREWKEGRQTGRDERSPGRAILTSLAPSDPVSGFPLSGYGECGWEGSWVLPSPFRHLVSLTWPLCRHTPPHSSLNCTRQHVNTIQHTWHHRALHLTKSPKWSLSEVAVGTKWAAEQEELQRNFDKYRGW